MISGLLETKAAPAERAEAAILADDVLRFREDAMAVQLLGASPDMFLILNEQRQIVFANEPTAAILGVQQPEEILGLRVGGRWAASTPMWSRAAAAPRTAGRAGRP